MVPRSARELRRQVTSTAIERAAVDLALEVGSEHLTVEMICERQLLSHRTFYNYFPSKEAALLGGGPPSASSDSTEEFRTGTSADVVGELVELLARPLLEKSSDDHALFAARQRLIEQEPELLEKAMARFGAFLGELTELVLARLEHMGRSREETPDVLDEATMIVALADTVMRRAGHQIVAAGDDADPTEILRRSVALARRVLTEGRRT